LAAKQKATKENGHNNCLVLNKENKHKLNIMKKVIIAIITIFTLGLAENNAQAQTPKFAHINYLDVVDSIPTWLDANRQLDEFIAMGQKTIGDMEKDLQADYDVYMAEQDMLSPLLREYREKELMEKQELLEYKKQSLESDLQIWNTRLFVPIETNLKKAIETIAIKFGITYMFEETQMLYAAPTGGLNLTKEVRAELIALERVRTGM